MGGEKGRRGGRGYAGNGGGKKESGRGRQTNGGRRGWEKAGQYVVASST